MKNGQPCRYPCPLASWRSGGSLGSGWYRTHFDPARYRLIGIDQRGTGKSRPAGGPTGEMDRQNTQQLIDDIEAVRRTLGIDAWVVTGISWGTTLALAYAQQHPHVYLPSHSWPSPRRAGAKSIG